ncbi:MAG TPA: 30S ribosomal protein S4 [Gemmatimonadaceae bacterium]
MSIRGPRLKIVRRLGTPLPGLTRKSSDRHPEPPGAHGATARRRRPSAYRRRLEEKQKVRFNYGVTERQLRRYFERASAAPGRTGEELLALLERRLDNVVFRLGFAPTIPAARQLIAHGHIRVGSRRVDRPAYEVRVGELIALAESARQRPALRDAAERGAGAPTPSFLARDPADACAGRMIAAPTRADVSVLVREAMIVEFYAR